MFSGYICWRAPWNIPHATEPQIASVGINKGRRLAKVSERALQSNTIPAVGEVEGQGQGPGRRPEPRGHCDYVSCAGLGLSPIQWDPPTPVSHFGSHPSHQLHTSTRDMPSPPGLSHGGRFKAGAGTVASAERVSFLTPPGAGRISPGDVCLVSWAQRHQPFHKTGQAKRRKLGSQLP
ncbi:aminotransferase [Platysternon megacephalum]|uniref:Aminotransferase n=1 Tax=Platysternon megacephalum TaxID=55544 RepID=A0A4D9DHG9_9SAUR|nr:aminotransferase [Platysternon megacephalum]